VHLVHHAVIDHLVLIVQDLLVVATLPLEMADALDHARDLRAEMPTMTITGAGAHHHPELTQVHHLVARHHQFTQIVWVPHLARLHIAKPHLETGLSVTSSLLQDLEARGVAMTGHLQVDLHEVSVTVKSRLLVLQVVLRQLSCEVRQVASTVLAETLPILPFVVVQV
jgi:hypothetical protein